MKKCLISIIVIVLLAAGGWAYWYYYIPLTERYVVSVSTLYSYPQNTSLSSKLDLKIEDVSVLYDKDEDAVESQRKHISELKESCVVLMNHEEQRIPQNESDKENKEMRIMTYKKLLYSSSYLLSFTHTRSYSTDEFFKILNENGVFSHKLEEYCKTNKLQYHIYDLD